MTKIKDITFACTDPDELATFWAEAIDGERLDLSASIGPVIVEPPGDGPNLLFEDLPRESRDDLAIHLDLAVENREAAVERLRDLGASVCETKSEEFEGDTNTWTVMEDPAGNGFCVAEY